MYSLLIIALCIAVSESQSTPNITCGIGVGFQDGDIVLDDIINGTTNILETTGKSLTSLTRQGKQGPFYTIGHQDSQANWEFTLFKYDPCGNTGLETIGTDEVIGYDVRGLAYNPNDNLLYVMFFNSINSINELYTINPYTASLAYIANVSEHNPTIEFDENGVLYGWSGTNGLFTINITTGVTNIISPISHIATDPFQFLSFDPNDYNIIYGGFEDVYKINKLDGTYTLTAYKAHSYRGFIILDQHTCDIVECSTDQPSTTAADNTVQAGITLEPTNLPDVNAMNNESIPMSMIIIGVIILFGFCCVSWYCRLYHKKKIKKEVSEPPVCTPNVTPEPMSVDMKQQDIVQSEMGANVIGVITSIPMGATPATFATYAIDNPMISTYNDYYNKLNVSRMNTLNVEKNMLNTIHLGIIQK